MRFSHQILEGAERLHRLAEDGCQVGIVLHLMPQPGLGQSSDPCLGQGPHLRYSCLDAILVWKFWTQSLPQLGQTPARVHILLIRSVVRIHAVFYQCAAVSFCMALALKAEGLWKLYDSGESVIKAVEDVSLDVEQGTMVAIMGPSGCGKTTLLNVLSGIDEPSSGSVAINGHNLYGSNDDVRTRVRGSNMGFIFQEFNLLPVMTALENVELPLLLQGKTSVNARDEASKALTAVGLGDRLHHRPAELSGGQQQRVAVARAVVHRPAIVLCDEPTGNLDTETSESIIGLLRTLCKVGNTTFLIVTHDHSIAEQCDRILQMADGKFLQASEEE